MASTIFPPWQFKCKVLREKRVLYFKHNSTTNDDNNHHSICWSLIGIEYNRYPTGVSGKIHRSSEAAIIPFNVNNNWQKDSSHSHKQNGITLFKKNQQIADFSVVTRDQVKFIKPVDTAMLNMIPEGDPNLSSYLNDLLRMKKPEKQNNTFCFPTAEHPGSHPNIDTNPERIPRSKRERKIELHRKCWNMNKICWKTWLHWYTAHPCWETGYGSYPCWVSWLFCQTQKGFWDEQGI